MSLISLKQYQIYCKLKGQHELLYERWISKKTRASITDKEFAIISKLISNMAMIQSGLYSEKTTENFKEENEQLRKFVDDEVYTLIEQHDWQNGDPW